MAIKSTLNRHIMNQNPLHKNLKINFYDLLAKFLFIFLNSNFNVNFVDPSKQPGTT